MQVFIFPINTVDGEKEDQFNGSPPRPQPRGPRTPPGPPPPDDDEDEPMPVSGRMRRDCVLFAVHHCLKEAKFCVPAQCEVSCLLLLLLDRFSFRKGVWKKRVLALLNCIILKDSR